MPDAAASAWTGRRCRFRQNVPLADRVEAIERTLTTVQDRLTNRRTPLGRTRQAGRGTDTAEVNEGRMYKSGLKPVAKPK